ncbi:uncharacterized protein LOC127081042 [Lathyrus oleraceus]|uniref:uncharacterized protein LOC127081042 n=1 Tax=Pisum sativum TaxID=3888 RepID=UPI0021D3749B|nr:uncharacterized protein LOC127081042 [Pisum sativum]
MAQKTEKVDQTGGHLTSHRENGTVGTKPQRTLCKQAKDNKDKIWVTPVKDSSWAQLGWMNLLLFDNVTHDVITLYYNFLNAEARSKNQIQHRWTKYSSRYYYFIRNFVKEKFRGQEFGLELADKLARNLGRIDYEEGKLGIWTLEKLSIYSLSTRYPNSATAISIQPLRKAQLGPRNLPQKSNNMSQHPSSSGSKSSQHAKTPPMEFVDDDIMDVTPLCMIPGNTTGTSSNAGDKQGNTSGNSSLPKDMYYTDRAIRRRVTRILSEGHKVEGVSTPLSRREPSPEREPHADKDDDSSRSEKEVAVEGLCSLGQTLPSKKQNVPQENIIDLEEESTEGEDDPLVHLVKPSVAEKLRSKKGKSMAKIRAARLKKTAGVGPSKPWSKVEVGKRKERHSSDSEENRRVAIERELGQEAVEVKEVIELIKNAGLVKTVATLPQCYEGLVKEFIMNIPEDIHDKNSREFCKVFVRGKCVKFSPNVINKFLGRGMDGGVDLETTDNEVCRAITAGQAKEWPSRNHLSAGKLSVKYAILYKIGSANWIPTNHASIISINLGRIIHAIGTRS